MRLSLKGLIFADKMPYGRIQKLLCDEYCQFDDTVLIESPFAETTQDGKGLEQVHLGITPTKLIIACDYFNSLCYDSVVWYGQDPEVETLELMSLYPVEYVNLSIFSRNQRQSLKATFANNVTRYFELGGLEKRKMFWNLWCERVLHLNPEEAGQQAESDSSADSSSRSSIFTWENYYYEYANRDKCKPERREGNSAGQRRKWTEKHLYVGSKREVEDSMRPTAVPGLGATAEIKLLYVKPQWPCTDASDTLCDKNLHYKESVCDYEVYTYTGEPTSNITYTSISKNLNGFATKSSVNA